MQTTTSKKSRNVIFPLKSVEEKYGFFYQLFRRLKKFFIHLVRGNSEIQRTCNSNQHSSELAICLKTSLLLSRQLNDIAEELFQFVDFDVGHTTEKIVEKKKIARNDRLIFNLNTCLLQFNAANMIFSYLLEERDQAYNVKSEKHEELLETLWSALKPNTRRRGGRFTKEWTEIGFQGKDPATDFRSMGILSLKQLVFFATKYPVESIRALEDSCHPVRWYPFSVTGINITGMMMDLMMERLLDHLVYREYKVDQQLIILKELVIESFHNLFCNYFVRFNKLWVDSKPEDLMAFPHIFKEFKSSVRKELLNISFKC